MNHLFTFVDITVDINKISLLWIISGYKSLTLNNINLTIQYDGPSLIDSIFREKIFKKKKIVGRE